MQFEEPNWNLPQYMRTAMKSAEPENDYNHKYD